MQITHHLASLVLICLPLCACAAGGDRCVDVHQDTAWESVDGRDVDAEIAGYLAMPRGVRSAESVFGEPWRKEGFAEAERFSWLRVHKRSARTLRCGVVVREVWQVSYIIVEVKGDNEAGCTVTIKSYIGRNEFPDIDQDPPVDVSSASCRDFLAP